jgi:hypothetical protein
MRSVAPVLITSRGEREPVHAWLAAIHPQTQEMMETIRHEGRAITVRQVTRTSHSRLLYSEDSREYFIGYPVSVGPYKIDIEGFHTLTSEEVAAYQAGTLDLAEFAYRLGQADQASGRYERKPAREE